jgi:hypothetical protein
MSSILIACSSGVRPSKGRRVGSTAADHLHVNVGHSANMGLGPIGPKRFFTGSVADSAPLAMIRQQPMDRLHERLRILGGHQQAVLAVSNGFPVSSMIGRHDGSAQQHGLDQRPTEGFVDSGHDEDIDSSAGPLTSGRPKRTP